jgi:hypothetical protein
MLLSPLPHRKTNILLNNLKKGAINKLGIKFQENGSSLFVKNEEKV